MKMVTTAVEHPAVLQPARRLKALGHDVVELPVNSVGQIDLDQLRAALKGTRNALVSVMWANNETGVVFPIREVAEIAKEYGATMHTDAVQVAGKVKIDVQKTPVDLLAISGHKFHAPKGVGALYIRRGTKIKPFMLGGHQESGRRAGTENVPYIVGLAKASYIEGEAIAYHLSDEGICISTGSACASGSLDPSHVIRAMGVPFTAVHGSIRFSLSRYNTMDEVDYVLEKLPPIIKNLRALSPFGPDKDPTTFK